MIALRAKVDSFKKKVFWAWLLVEYIRYWLTLKIPFGIVIGGLARCLQGKSFLSQTWLWPWNDFLLLPCGLALAYGAAGWYRNHKTKRTSMEKSHLLPRTHPLSAEFFLWLFLPRDGRESTIGDTNEQFEIMIERFGPTARSCGIGAKSRVQHGPLFRVWASASGDRRCSVRRSTGCAVTFDTGLCPLATGIRGSLGIGTTASGSFLPNPEIDQFHQPDIITTSLIPQFPVLCHPLNLNATRPRNAAQSRQPQRSLPGVVALTLNTSSGAIF